MAFKRTPRLKRTGRRPNVPIATHPSSSALLAKAGFRLSLGRTVWHLIGTEGTEAWLEEFARILKLETWGASRADKGPVRKLIFWDGLKPSSDSTRDLLPWAGSAGPGSRGWVRQWTNSIGMWTHPDNPDVVLEIPPPDSHMTAVDNMIKSCYAFFLPVISEGGLVLHAALIEKNGQGVALAASGGVGKSTCARRIPAPWKALCDDTCLILPDGRSGFQAHPFATWSDYLWELSRGTWKVESHVPLNAVFFLKPAEQDNTQPLGQGESSIYLCRSSHELLSVLMGFLDREKVRSLRQKIFANACALGRMVPAYWLEVNLKGRFWTKIEQALDQRPLPKKTSVRPEE